MKKVVLLSLSSLLVASAAAYDGGKVFTDTYFQSISPNGQYIVGDRLGSAFIYDRSLNTPITLLADDDHEYTTGLGNSVSNTRVVLCQEISSSVPTYWYDGDFYEVSAPEDGYFGAQLHGITPDGSRIVGCVDASGIPGTTYTAMQSPAYWDLQDDGSYGEYHLLPCPTKDFAGREPQYITATYVSDNGKVVAGQVFDRTGMYIQPIIYTQGENGEWSYKLPLAPYYDITLCPEQPGEEPEMPSAKNMLTDEQKAQYDADVATWKAEGGSNATKPKYADYLTEEQAAELETAMATYEDEYAVWEEQMLAYNEFWESLPRFAPNDIRMSPDGTVISTNNEQMINRWFSIYMPTVIDIATGELNVLYFEEQGEDPLIITQIIDANTYIAFNTLQALKPSGFVITTGDYGEMALTNIYDYLCNTTPEVKTWAEENLRHETTIWDDDADTEVSSYEVYTGMTIASADMSVFAISTSSEYWEDRVTPYSYVIDLNPESGVNNITVANTKLGFDATGNLNLGDDVTSAQVYDLSGRLVLSEGENASKLASGLYIIRALRNDGTTVAAKVRK